MKSYWDIANEQLIAKVIGELTYEEILKPVAVTDSKLGREQLYQLKLQSSAVYEFKGWMTVWGYLRVTPESLKRHAMSQAVYEEERENHLVAAQFFLDAEKELGMSSITLAKFLEEMKSTLYSDEILLKKNKDMPAQTLMRESFIKMQSYLNGHPKILLNKGRMGWSPQDINQYSPECFKSFKLRYLAVKKSLTLVGRRKDQDVNDIYQRLISEDEQQRFCLILKELDCKLEDYIFVPVHPWQWERVIRLQFIHEISNKNIIDLGSGGTFYLPQISLRTLSAVDGKHDDIKLPLSILNTSAVRGISAKYISSAPKVSQAVSDICQKDKLLKSAGMEVLQDIFGLSVVAKDYQRIKDVPYRYNEFLGFILRESVDSKLGNNEQAVMTGSLFHQDTNGKSLVGAYIHASGLSIQDWLSKYFKVSVIPLYHLQVKYGLGLVAHGQNIVLKMKNYVPSGIFIKDFQGDLRMAEGFEDQDKVFESLDKLPPEYLIHDLFTGHILTVLRFMSAVLFESDGFSEKDFYKILALEIKKYLEDHKIKHTNPYLNLLNPNFHRVLLNKVRFSIGYEDTTERLKPFLGSDLINPLNIGVAYEFANV